MDRDEWVPPVVDMTKPSAARMYDYILGGKDHYAVDRQAADQLVEMVPTVRDMALANRAFLGHAVHEMARRGIRQFLDLGSGLPTSPNVHELAREFQPDARVVYVDLDPVVLAYHRARVSQEPGTVTLFADLCQPAEVLSHPALRAQLDLSEPVGLIMVAVLHFVGLSLAPHVVGRYVRELVPGSMVALTAGQLEGTSPEVIATLERVYQQSPTPFVWRVRAQIEHLLDGLELIEPGLTDLSTWQPDLPPGTARYACALGVKPPART